MQKRNKAIGMAAFIGILILILDSSTALKGASQGIALCAQVVIPSLFPFFLLSVLVTGAASGTQIPLLRPISKLFHIPTGAESILIAAFLGGYPVGAQAVAGYWRCGQLSREDAQRMLAFCNNPGPAFLFGMVAACFPEGHTPWLLWGIIILSALFVSRIFPIEAESISPQLSGKVSPVIAMETSVKAMASVCGWIVIFRVLITFLSKWILGFLPSGAKVAATGILELSNGICALTELDNLPLRFLLCGVFLSLGGLCVTMQTASVCEGLSLKYYFAGKAVQTLITFILCLCILKRLWTVPIFLLAVLCIPIKIKNSGSIPRKAIV